MIDTYGAYYDIQRSSWNQNFSFEKPDLSGIMSPEFLHLYDELTESPTKMQGFTVEIWYRYFTVLGFDQTTIKKLFVYLIKNSEYQAYGATVESKATVVEKSAAVFKYVKSQNPRSYHCPAAAMPTVAHGRCSCPTNHS